MTTNDTEARQVGQAAEPLALRLNDQLGAGLSARRHERGAAHELLLLAAVLIAAASVLVWIFRAAHEDEPMLRAECEARGGMLIRTQSPLYTCVGKPASAPANK